MIKEKERKKEKGNYLFSIFCFAQQRQLLTSGGSI
jgi:hypothetical protein